MATHNEPQPEQVENEGGSVSPVQFSDTESAPVIQHGADDEPVQRVTSAATGAKRDSFFKERDYKP
jgi:hypothetical protein